MGDVDDGIDYSKIVIPAGMPLAFIPKTEKQQPDLKTERQSAFVPTILKKVEVRYIRQFLIFGLSSDVKDIVRFVEFLTEALRRDAVDDITKIIVDISTSGRSIKQDALLLCLVKCYMHDKMGQQAVSEVILDLWRTPTHLFKTLMIMMSEEHAENNNTEDYYKTLLKNLATKGKICTPRKGKKSKKCENTGSTNDNETCSKQVEGSERKGKEIKRCLSKPKTKLVCKWYTDPDKSAEDLLMMLKKYPSRYDWNHQTLIRLTHPCIPDTDPEKEEKDTVIGYASNGLNKKVKEALGQFEENLFNPRKAVRQTSNRVFKYISVLEEVKKEKDNPVRVAEIVKASVRHELGVDIPFTLNVPVTPSPEMNKPFVFPCHYESKEKKLSRFHLTIELLPTEIFNYEPVWQELIKDLPMTAMLRNLAHMSSLKLFDKDENVNYIKESFMNEHRLYPFVHPFQILKALMAYTACTPMSACQQYKKKKKERKVYPEICEILNDAFHLSLLRKEKCISFDNCALCIDISPAMSKDGFLGVDMFTAAKVSVAIATVIEQKGKDIRIYTCGSELKLLENRPVESEGMDDSKTLLQQRIDAINECRHGEEANLSLLINQACEKRTEVGTFMIFTKSIESQYNTVKEAYTRYKEVMDRDATKLVVCSMETVSTETVSMDTDNDVIFVCGGDADVMLEMYLGMKEP